MKTKMKFMDVQIQTRGQLPGLNRRGPIPSITLDTKTVVDLIESGVEVCNLDGERIYVKDVVMETAKEIADTVKEANTSFTQPQATLVHEVKEVTEIKTEIASGEAMNEGIAADVIKNAGEVLTEETDKAITEATEPAAPEAEEVGEDEKAEAAGEKLTPDGIPVFVPDPNMSKNQQKKARNAYYAKMRAERDAANAATPAESK